jgi:hypothetical protein
MAKYDTYLALRNCSNPKAAICYRTYRSGQQNTGCPTSGKAELCCDIHLNPHREWLFQAIRLRQPSTVVVLRYRILERTPSRRSWTKTVDQSIKIALNKGATTLELTNLNRDPRSDHRLQITAGFLHFHSQKKERMQI